MELRSSRLKNEYKALRITLNGMGFYEEGMELQEMRQVLDALQMSATEGETNFLDCDTQQALRESQLDFMTPQDGSVLNSTMMSICSSPEIPSEIISVQAEVHHEMDWSPPNQHLPRKRFTSSSMVVDSDNISAKLESNNDLLEPDAKRFHDMCATNSIINNHEENSNNSTENSSEISTNGSLHEIRGPVSERRIHDSGFIMSYETAYPSSSNTSNNFTPPSSDCLDNSAYSDPELLDNIHEIRGPISVRRIHDSGLNISAEPAYKSFINNLIENSNNYMENSMEFSTSSASNPDNFDGDSETAI